MDCGSPLPPLEARRQAELDAEFKPICADWCVGSEQFRADMLDYIERQRGKWHYGSELRESSQAKAEQLIRQALSTQGIPDEQLGRWRKAHPFKLRLLHPQHAKRSEQQCIPCREAPNAQQSSACALDLRHY